MCIRTSKFWQTPTEKVSSPFTPTDKQKGQNTKVADSALAEEVHNFLNKDIYLDPAMDNASSEDKDLDILSKELLQVFSWDNIDNSSEAQKEELI